MAFQQIGDIPVVITGTKLAKSTFTPNDPQSCDVCLYVETEDKTQADWYKMNISANQSRMSNKNHMTCAQVTLEMLQELGFQGNDISRLQGQNELIGARTSAHVEEKQSGGKTYKNIKWLGGSSYTPADLDPSAIAGVMALVGGGQPQQQQQPMQQQQAAPGSFGQAQAAPQQQAQVAPGGFAQPQQQQQQAAPQQQQQAAPGGFAQQPQSTPTFG